LAAFVAALCLRAVAAIAQPVCQGTDLLAALARTRPEVHAAILKVAQAGPNGEAMLWRISGPDQKVSWLFGTIHLTDPRAHALSPAIREALAAARVLALEVDDIGAKPMQKALAQNQTLLVLGGDRGLDRLLGPDELKTVRDVTGRLGIAPSQAAALRPWFVTTMLSLPGCETARQEAGLKPLDMALRDRAVALRIRVVGLETIGDQLKAMASIGTDAELAWLRASLALYPRIDDMTETLLQLYLKRRIAATWEVSQALAGPHALGPGQLREVQQALVGRRNLRMRDAAIPLLQAGGAFIGVGALHLPGEDGLVALMRAKGFTVTAVE